jgi:hypothetical protein
MWEKVPKGNFPAVSGRGSRVKIAYSIGKTIISINFSCPLPVVEVHPVKVYPYRLTYFLAILMPGHSPDSEADLRSEFRTLISYNAPRPRPLNLDAKFR